MFIGRFQLLGRIAAGGMAEVHLARTAGAGGFTKVVVLKRVLPNLASNPEFISLFLNEARLMAQLTHPNVVQCFELGQDADTYFLAMEFVSGATLAELIRSLDVGRQRVPIAVALKITSQVLEGLSYAHALTGEGGRPLQVIHRDISPHNILLGR